MAEVQIRQVAYRDPLARTLVEAVLGELAERYGGDGDSTPVDHGDFDPPRGAFLVAVSAGTPVACAGWRSHGENGSLAELKRMYTVPRARGQGLARLMLAAVEESARTYGRKRLILETGDKQPEAIALYETAGYERIEDFGFYRGHPGVLSFGRDL